MRRISFLFLLFSYTVFSQDNLYKEKFRPQFHFTPPLHWINDPNGLVYHKGTYHLFYQHNPMGIRWGHMSWGHATSKDLVHWKHLPVAIAEEKDTMIFSGTCIADFNNSSGFGKNGQTPLVAIYTGHIEGINQSQHVAYSLDEGVTWKKHEENPVLDLHKKDFRDPKIFWHDEKKYWVMLVMLPIEHLVQFYSSSNLKDWKHLSDFGPAGDTSGIWECPDLTRIPVEGEPGKKKWLLQMSVGASMQYFIGGFDGTRFINESTLNKIFRPDYGPDYYAAIAYNQLPDSIGPTVIGWVNNWSYANDIPTMPWRGMMSLPRTLSVKKIDGDWLLFQRPVESLKSLRSDPIVSISNAEIGKSKTLPITSQQFEINAILEPSASSTCGIKLAVGGAHEFEIGYNATTQTLYMDRSKAGNIDFSPEFKKRFRSETKLLLNNRRLQLTVFFDHSIVELFANDGRTVMTMQLFPGQQVSGVELFSNGGKTLIESLTIRNLRSCW
ncbi:MAG TPA: glycoside hydrolase family 32 protein [Chitinophagaceae bacterium]|nr:glycoside hydrolase family 32 protein [Chitinophagaceae bacterium]